MKTTFYEKIIFTLGVVAVILLAPILLVIAVVKTIFTFLMGGFRAIKDEQ